MHDFPKQEIVSRLTDAGVKVGSVLPATTLTNTDAERVGDIRKDTLANTNL